MQLALSSDTQHDIIDSYVCNSPIGRLGFSIKNNAVLSVEFNSTDSLVDSSDNKINDMLKKELDDYFNKLNNSLNLPYILNGTEFQKRVWKTLLCIPYGETTTYGELAALLNSSARAVGNACRNNPVPLIIPCHRVVAKNGLGGFSGETSGQSMQRKAWLLRHEGAML